jgi:hypothetical protein
MPDMGNAVIGLIGVLNIGMIVYLVRLVIAPLAETMRQLSISVKELYESRDSHEVEITRIQTVHKLRGCDAPIKGHD